MNPEYPPLQFAPPLIRPRRRSRPNFPKPPELSADERRAIYRRFREQREAIDRAVRTLSPEERRAIFLRLKHDRPLTKKDFSGTDLVLMSASGENESLVITHKAGFEKFDERMETFAKGEAPARPKGTELATALQAIELGDPKDRLSDELLTAYDEWIAADWLIYEIEVVSFAKNPKSQQRELTEILDEIRHTLGHVHGNIFEHEPSGRSERAVLRSTGAKFREFVEHPNWWRKITSLDTRPRFETFSQVFQQFRVGDVSIAPPPPGAETVCIVDSGTAALNPFIEPVLRRDISRSFVPGCSPTEDQHGHGSGVASLAAYYDIEYQPGGVNEAAAFICSARIMTDEGQLDVPRVADADEDRRNQSWLLSRILREVVSHFRPLGVRVFVLSFQILGHVWSESSRRLVARNAWAARAIDQLSREFDVVFVAITGNVPPNDVADLLEGSEHPRHLLSPLAKVLDPGHAALAVTVGSVAHSAKVVVAPHVAIAAPGQPSPFTRSGPGFGGSIKPDVVERGGNLVRDDGMNSVRSNPGTDIVMASGSLTPALQHSNGTSFAAPRVAHHLALILRDLHALGIEPSAPLLRAFLAASARRPEGSEMLDDDGNLALLGFGQPDGFKALDCEKHSALLFWQGDMAVNQTAIFRLHSLKDGAEIWRVGGLNDKLAVATAPRVQPWGVAEYLGAELKFRLYRGDKDAAQVEALLQREDDEANIASKVGVKDLGTALGITRRSHGTLQADTHVWTKHETDYSGDDYTLSVALTGTEWSKEGDRVPVAVVVRVEDTTAKCEVLYERVSARNQARARTRAQVVRFRNAPNARVPRTTPISRSPSCSPTSKRASPFRVGGVSGGLLVGGNAHAYFPATTPCRFFRPFSNCPPTILSQSMKSPAALAMKLFVPAMLHVITVFSPSAWNVNSAVFVAAKGLRNSIRQRTSSPGRLSVIVIVPSPTSLLPAQR